MRTHMLAIPVWGRPAETMTVEAVEATDLVAAFETEVRRAGVDPESPEVHDAVHAMLALAGIVRMSTWGEYLSAEGARHALGRALTQCGVTSAPVPDAGGVVTWH
jgi:hypothetical protein